MAAWRDFWQPWLNRFMWVLVILGIAYFAAKESGTYDKIKSAVMKVLGDVGEAKKKVK